MLHAVIMHWMTITETTTPVTGHGANIQQPISPISNMEITSIIIFRTCPLAYAERKVILLFQRKDFESYQDC